MSKPQLPKNYIASHAAIASAMLIWAAAGPIIKLALEDIPVFALLLFRFTLVCVITLPYLILELKKDPIYKQDIPGMIIMGLSGQTVIAIAFIAFKYTTALDAALISIIGTILTFVAGRYFFNEKITTKESIGIGIATLGTLYVVIEPAFSQEVGIDVGQRIFGNILMVIYQLGWPIYVVLGKYLTGNKSKEVNKVFKFMKLKPLSKEYHPNTITAVSFFVGLATFIPMAIIEAFTTTSYPVFSFSAVSSIIFLAVFSSIAAYGLHQWGLKYVEAQETALYSYLSPIFTIPFAYLLLAEIPSKTLIAGSLIIAVGVTIAEKYKS